MTYKPKKYKIKSVKEFTNDIKLFRIPAKLNPKPGQFFEVSVLGIGECTLASCSNSKDYLDLLIRNAGGVTNEIFKLKKGDNIFIRGPYGKGYPLEHLQGKDLIFIAGGTGVAPVTSLIEYVEQNMKKLNLKNSNINIYLGFRSSDYILLKDKIARWKKKFNLTISLDKPEKNWRGKTGLVCNIIKLNKKQDTIAFLCGPEVMMKTSTDSLIKQGMHPDKIFWSMERRMECGFGNCGRCLIQDVYVCKDGPVFQYSFIKPKLDNEEASNKVK